MDQNRYHLDELRRIHNVFDPGRVLPRIKTHHRRILDLGCGAGQTLIGSAIPAGVQAVGVDIDKSALALGRALSDRIEFVMARGEALPFRAGAFDLLVCRVALPYMEIGRVAPEMFRLLGPGGDLWLTLHAPTKVLLQLCRASCEADVKEVLVQLYALANGCLLHCFGREYHMPLRPRRRESFQTEKGMRRALGRVGFSQIEFERDRGVFVARARKI